MSNPYNANYIIYYKLILNERVILEIHNEYYIKIHINALDISIYDGILHATRTRSHTHKILY